MGKKQNLRYIQARGRLRQNLYVRCLEHTYINAIADAWGYASNMPTSFYRHQAIVRSKDHDEDELARYHLLVPFFLKSRSDTRFSCLVEVVVHVGIDRDAYTERRQLNSIIQVVFITKTNKQSHKYIIIAAVECLI